MAQALLQTTNASTHFQHLEGLPLTSRHQIASWCSAYLRLARESVALRVVVVVEAVEVLLSRRGRSCCTERRVALGSAR